MSKSLLLWMLLSILGSFSLKAQQTIRPVTNLSVERVNEFFDDATNVAVLDGFFYFILEIDNAAFVYGSDGTTDGTQRLSTTREDLTYGFAVGEGYVYVKRNFNDRTEIRYAEYRAGTDELLTFTGERGESGVDYQSTVLPDGTAVLTAYRPQRPLDVLFIDPTENIVQTYTLTGTGGEDIAPRKLSILPNGDLALLAEDRPFSIDTKATFLLRMSAEMGVVDTLTRYPLAQFVTDSELIDASVYSFVFDNGTLQLYRTTTSETLVVEVISTGVMRSAEVSSLVSFAGQLYFMVKNNNQTGFFRYSPERNESELVPDAPEGLYSFALAPGPDGAEVLYTLSSRNNSVRELSIISTDGVFNNVRSFTGTFSFNPQDALLATSYGVFFNAGSNGTGEEPYVSDGTLAGTRAIEEINPGSASSRVENITPVRETVFFTAEDPLYGIGVFAVDANGEQLRLITNFNTGITSQSIFNLLPFGDKLLFRGAGRQDNTEWWISEGSRTGTKKIAELNPDEASTSVTLIGPRPGSSDLLFFVSVDRDDNKLASSDGTISGTVVSSLNTFLTNTRPLAYLDDRVLYGGGIDRNFGLIGTDGTPASTEVLYATDSPINYLARAGDRVFATISDQRQLVVSDGTAGGTQLIWEFPVEGNFSTPLFPTPVGESIVFEGFDNDQGYELWTSDGTEAGTRRLTELNDFRVDLGGFASLGDYAHFLELNSFSITVWRTDGTESGTVPLKTLDGRGDSGPFIETGVFRGKYYFAGTTQENGRELWVSDGTENGTVQLLDLMPGTDGSFPYNFTVAGDLLYFIANSPMSSLPTLYKTDGTEAGTVPLLMAQFYEFVEHNGKLYFVAETEETGRELYISDGTVAGTRLFEDYVPGPDSSFPRQLTSVAGRLFFEARNLEIGTELHVLTDCPVPADFAPRRADLCGAYVTLNLAANLGTRYAVVTGNNSPVDVNFYADCIEVAGTPGDAFLLTLSVDANGNCGAFSFDTEVVIPSETDNCTITTKVKDTTLPLNIRLYPNPTSGSIRLELTDHTGSGLFEILDVRGHRLARVPFQNETTVVDLSGYPSGIYLVYILTADGRRGVRQVVVR